MIGWMVFLLIGPLAGVDGITQKFQYGTLKMNRKLSSHLMVYTFNLGRMIRLQTQTSWTGNLSRDLAHSVNYRINWVNSSERRKYSTPGWTLLIQISSFQDILVIPSYSNALFQRQLGLRVRRLSEHGCTTLY